MPRAFGAGLPGKPGPGIERGDEEHRQAGFPRPLAKSGLDLAIEVRTLASASAGRTPMTVGCILSRSWSPAFRKVEALRRPSIPIRFLWGVLRPKPSNARRALILPPAR